MNRFSLASFAVPAELPASVEWRGGEYPVHTDFRRVLLALKLMGDPNVIAHDKRRLLAEIMYPGRAPADPWTPLQAFIRCGMDENPDRGDRDFDYEQDAPEIYAAFMQVYHIDLIAVPGMHWWTFVPLLNGVFASDNALSNKVRLRHLDDSKTAQKAATDRAKRNAALAEEVSAADAMLDKRIHERLKAGKPIDDLLGR